MTSLRLLADDLSGALDTAAEFVGLCGAFDVSWAGALPPQIPSSLAAENIDARLGQLEAELSEDVHVFDAEGDGDLDRVVEVGRRHPGPVLWCGSGGLAGALARGGSSSLPGHLRRPVLGFFGSDQAI